MGDRIYNKMYSKILHAKFHLRRSFIVSRLYESLFDLLKAKNNAPLDELTRFFTKANLSF